MSEKPHEEKWPNKDEIKKLMRGPDVTRRDLTFSFQFHDNYGPLPFAISTNPNLYDMQDEIILLIISTTIRALSRKHGLEEALKKVNDIAYGRIDGKRAFKMGGMSIPTEESEDNDFLPDSS